MIPIVYYLSNTFEFSQKLQPLNNNENAIVAKSMTTQFYMSDSELNS